MLAILAFQKLKNLKFYFQKGGLSKSKDQRVLYKAYLDKLIELNLDVSEYEDILTILKEKSILNIVQKAQINIEMLERIGNNINT